MAKGITDDKYYKGIAESLRKINGTDKQYTPSEMIEAVATVLDDMVYILVDETGNEVPAVLVEEKVELTAGPNDIRSGTVAVTGAGVVIGEKNIPAYYVTEGYRLISKGSSFETSTLDYYDFTKLQVIICPFSGSLSTSMAAEKVVIGENVYPVNSNESISTVVRDATTRKIKLGITNDSNSICVMRYFTYKEEL